MVLKKYISFEQYMWISAMNLQNMHMYYPEIGVPKLQEHML